jgi:mycothiol synthase
VPDPDGLAIELPAGFRFRPPTQNDLDAVADLLLADQRADGVEPTLDAHFLRQVWSRPDFDLATDAWLVTDGAGGVVGYGQVRREEADTVGSWGVVHPEVRGRGIGSALFSLIEARTSTLLAGAVTPRFRHSLNGGDGAAAAMLTAKGFRPIRHFWHMQIDLDGHVEPGSSPDGIDVGGIEPRDDLPAIHGILQAAFAGDPLDQMEPFDRWVDESTSSPSYDPTLWLLARDAGVPVGALIASVGDDVGWVDWLAVLASHRGRGIGGALLQRSFAAIGARGLRRVRVNVDAENVTGATAVYERVGMRVVNRWDLWERRG